MKINDIIINESIGLGDNFDIELGNMIIESRVVGFMNDGVIIEADNKALALLGLGGALLESAKQGVAEGGFFDPDQPDIGDMVKHINGATDKVKKIGTQGDETHVYFKDKNGEMNFGMWK